MSRKKITKKKEYNKSKPNQRSLLPNLILLVTFLKWDIGTETQTSPQNKKKLNKFST